jgi:adenosine deaminase
MVYKTERLKKNEIKQYQTYIDRLETDRIAHGTLLQTSEEIIGRFTDAQIVKASNKCCTNKIDAKTAVKYQYQK